MEIIHIFHKWGKRNVQIVEKNAQESLNKFTFIILQAFLQFFTNYYAYQIDIHI